jgi:hypothetical protein
MSPRFDDLWQDKLQPWLAELEGERAAAFRWFWIWLSLGLILGVAGFVAVGTQEGPVQLALISLLGLPVFGGAIGASRLSDLAAKVKRELMGQIAAMTGLRYALKPYLPSRFMRFEQHGLLPGHDRRHFEDHFEGEIHGADFELYEAHLEKRHRTRNGTRWVTAFRGVLIRITFPRKVEGITVITRDKGWFNGLEALNRSFGSHTLERIGLVDPKFEKAFEVYGDDQVVARYMLSPSFMERLLALEAAFKGKNVRAAFDADSGKGELLIAAETGNQFEVSSVMKPVPERTEVMKVVNEIALVTEIIDLLVKPSVFGDHGASIEADAPL